MAVAVGVAVLAVVVLVVVVLNVVVLAVVVAGGQPVVEIGQSLVWADSVRSKCRGRLYIVT